MVEPDWSSLADIQSLLYNRISDLLNAALSSIALSGMPEAQEQPPEFWRDRATHKIYDVLNLYTAWTALSRFKGSGITPEHALRPFPINLLLNWLGTQLQLSPIPSDPSNLILYGGQETLQEALWLLYSVSYTQGSSVRLELETSRLGAWFRVRFTRSTPLPASMDDLLASFGSHWRAQDTAFELATARDFIRLNGSDLALASGDGYGEFAFFVRAAASGKTRPLNPDAAAKAALAASSPPETLPTTPPPEALPSDATPAFPEARIVPPPKPSIPPILRPLPLPRAASSRPARSEPAESLDPAKKPESVEGVTPDVEPPGAAPQADEGEAKPDVVETASASAGTVIRLTPDDTPVVSPSPAVPAPEPPAPGTVIVPVKIPAPHPPRRLVAPPASTTAGALIRQTQTLPPVQSKAPAPASEGPTAGQSPAPEPPHEAPAADANTASSPKEDV